MARISSGDTYVEVLPELGGTIARFSTVKDGQTIDWLTPRSEATPGCFPMVPFASRITEGAFIYEGKQISLPVNVQGENVPIHGFAWQSTWRLVKLSERKVLLRYEHRAGAWPWQFRVDLSYSLSGRSLLAEIEVTNRSVSAMPLGLGFHPYFPVTDECQVFANVTHEWLLDEMLLPLKQVAFEPRSWHPQKERLDNVYSGWDQRAEIIWPERENAVILRASECFEHFVLFSPGEYFCAEPISNMVDGFNMMARGEAGHGVNVLAPQSKMFAWMQIEPRLGV